MVATVCIKVLRVCAFAASRSGLDPGDVAARLDLTPEQLADPHARVPEAVVRRAWEEIPELAGDPAFGLHAAESLLSAFFDVLDYATARATTVRSAIDCLVRYQRLHHDDVDLRLALAGGEAALSLSFRAAPRAPRHFTEFILATWVLRLRALTGVTLGPSLVRFQHDAPADIREHRRIFGAPLAFHAVESGVSLPIEVLDLPIRGADPGLFTLLERHAAELLGKLPANRSVRESVRAHVVKSLVDGPPSVADVARALGMSARSLQRALQADGQTFQGVVDEARRDLALAHLADRGRTVSEIAFLLGFTEVGAFTRAFRRWTGRSPVAHRRGGTPG